MHIAMPVPGEVVWIRQRRWFVERARRDRNVVRLDVRNRDGRLTFLAPFDRPTTIERAERPRHAGASNGAARLAHLAARSYSWPTIASALDAGIEIFPYQLEAALAIVNGARRVLLADAVGLGKTIQAGLAIAEIHRRSGLTRTLIVVPAALRDQWIDELSRRFRLDCRPADRDALDALARHGGRGENPWRRPGVWIASFDYIKQQHVMDALPLDPWHLLVVDEAHIACGESDRHDACAELARRARQVLLLSATPHDGDETRFTRLIDLGALNGVEDSPVVFRRTRAGVGFDLPRRARWHRVALSPAETDVLRALREFESAALHAAGRDHRDAAILLLSVFRKRALSTMRALRISLDRRLAWLGDGQRAGDFEWLQPRLVFDDESDELDDGDRASLTGDFGLQSAQERSWLRRLRALAETAERFETKVTRVTALVARAREPVVIFTEFRHSLEVLRRRVQVGSPIAELHGGLTPLERRQQLDRFLKGTASVLLATDVGGQGLNLQDRARWVVTLELPWNPLKLEQRCGRVDRIGQSRPVHFTMMVARHEFESGLLTRLATRALIARRAVGEDVLRGVFPETTDIGGALFEDIAIDPPAASRPALTICRSWARPARALARGLISRRTLARRWRAPEIESPGTFWTAIDRLPAIRAAASAGVLLVFSVPLIDGSGAVVERHVVAIRADSRRELRRFDARGLLRDRALIDAARSTAARALAARARRLARRLRRQLDADLRLDAALASRVLTSLVPAEVQPGLFDRRELRALDRARSDADAVQQGVDDRRADRERQTEITVGRPALELAFIADR
ncbi:MAG TPA: helicase-related protein [Vicinamibacterales bacterium]|nr:helicase-related protein [Vicinamibacterales bacterium]